MPIEKIGRLWHFAQRVYISEVKPRMPFIKAAILYSRFVGEGDLCFDVGASIGGRTKVLLNLGANVVAIEPQKSCAEELEQKYRDTGRVKVVKKALGAAVGEAEMMICDCSTMSSMSRDWITSVQESGRFSDLKWELSERVEVTTLDNLIEEFGKPVFCKIDVEGYEHQVLLGLSQPIKTISFEFVPEFIHAAIESVEHLATLGTIQFNYSVAESMRMALHGWVGSEEICRIIREYPDKDSWGMSTQGLNDIRFNASYEALLT